ncbi:fibronectin type III domain-containing protein [Candidatus Riflebacteria bacterium]
MTHKIFLRYFIFFFFLVAGCSLYRSDDQATPWWDEEENLKNPVLLSGEIELPESQTGAKIIPHGISGKFVYSNEELIGECNGEEFELFAYPNNSRKATYKFTINAADVYEFVIFNRKKSMFLKAYLSHGKHYYGQIDSSSTAKAILYEEKKRQTGKDFSYNDFENVITENDYQSLKTEIEKKLSDSEFFSGGISITGTPTVVQIVSVTVDKIPTPTTTSSTSTIPGGPTTTSTSSTTTSTSGTTSTTSTSTTTSTSSTSTTSTSTTTTTAGAKPSATLNINNGAEFTNSRTVTLNLSNIVGNNLEMSVASGAYEALNATRSYLLADSDSVQLVTVKLKDDTGQVSDDITDTITLDRSVPTISGISASDVDDTSSYISWTTNENGTSQVEYGTTLSFGNAESVASYVQAHQITLQNLTIGNTYYFRVSSDDQAGNSGQGVSSFVKGPQVNITNLRSISIGITSATIGFDTNHKNATYTLFYLEPASLQFVSGRQFSKTITTGAGTASRSVDVDGLLGSTTYEYSIGYYDPVLDQNQNTSSNTVITGELPMGTLSGGS